MKPKLNIRRCKNCNEKFQKKQPLQFVCTPKCAIEYQKLLKKNKEAKEWRDEKKTLKISVYSKEYKSSLQREINKLARLIDANFFKTCIDCGKFYGKQVDGAHYHSVGANTSTRWNLHNIHSADSQCNRFSDTHKEGYRVGLSVRYGVEYVEMVDNLPLQYKVVKLSNNEVVEKLAIVRQLIRSFDTYTLISPESARTMFNKIIGIYS